jgi:hypothetical protein
MAGMGHDSEEHLLAFDRLEAAGLSPDRDTMARSE